MFMLLGRQLSRRSAKRQKCSHGNYHGASQEFQKGGYLQHECYVFLE